MKLKHSSATHRSQRPAWTALLFLSLLLCLTIPLTAQHVDVAPGVSGARLADVHDLQGQLFHVQGIDLDQNHIWVTSVDKQGHKGYLHQFNRATGKIERQVDITDGPRYHPGGFSVAGDSIWIPVAEYTAHSSAVIEEVDRHTLAIKRKIPVADHLSCLAVTADRLIAGNWDSRQLLVFDFKGKQLDVINNPSATSYQDIKYVDGLLVGAGPLTRSSGSIDWFVWPSMKQVRTLNAGLTDRQKIFSGEGMALQGNDLYLLPEDGPSRYFHFVLQKP